MWNADRWTGVSGPRSVVELAGPATEVSPGGSLPVPLAAPAESLARPWFPAGLDGSKEE